MISNSCRCSGDTEAEKTAEFRAKLTACDHVYEEVVDEYRISRIKTHIMEDTNYSLETPIPLTTYFQEDSGDGHRATEKQVDNTSGDHHDCRNDGLGGG